MLSENGLSELRNAILDVNHDKDSMCKECRRNVLEKYNFQSHLFVDYSVSTDKQYAASIGIKKNL